MTQLQYSGGHAVITYDGVSLLCYKTPTGDLKPVNNPASTIDRIAVTGGIMRVHQRDGTNTTAYKGIAGNWHAITPIIEARQPNPPTGLRPNGAIIAPGNTFTFEWTHNPVDGSAQTAYQIRISRNSGTWTTLSGTTASSRAYSLPNWGNYRWQVRTRGRSVEWSDWSGTATLMVASVPNSPASLNPNGGTIDLGTAVTFSWLHRPTDGTAQTAREWRIRRGTSGSWTVRTNNVSTNSTTFTPSAAGLYQWQVRTKGLHPNWSPWSAVASVTMATVSAWQWPFPRRSITSGYMTPGRPTHRAIDFALPDAPYLAPIPCIGSGTVERVGKDAYGGLFVIVNHGNVPGYGTIRSHYVHQDSNAVSVGQSVSTGQIIGYVGYTGRTIPPGVAGAHLHMQINLSNDPYNGPTMNPVTFLEGVGATGA